jgi:hypothetical protein
MTSRILINRNSKTHVALLYLKMVHRPVTKENLFNLAPAKYKELNKAEVALERLVELTYAKVNENMYTITPAGLRAIPLIIRENPKKALQET